MLDDITALIAETLGISTTDVNRKVEALLDEQGKIDARYAATTALFHPEGSTTPLDNNLSRTQNRYADLRKKAEKTLPKVLSLLLAMKIAEARRDEARRHRDDKWSTDWVKDTTGMRVEAIEWFDRLHKLGVKPQHLHRFSPEMTAIIADLIVWKAKDQDCEEADNPWRAVLGIYGARKIKRQGTAPSVSGRPEPDRHNVGAGDYRFDEMVQTDWGVKIPEVEDAAMNPEESSTRPTFDCSIYPLQLPQKTAGDDAHELPDDVLIYTLVEMHDQVDTYVLPSCISDEMEAKLRTAATPLADDDDYDGSLKDLRVVTQYRLDDLSDEEAIALVEAATATRGCTPFEHFLIPARLHGRTAGQAAYREATIRRIMCEIATDPGYAAARKNLGME